MTPNDHRPRSADALSFDVPRLRYTVLLDGSAEGGWSRSFVRPELIFTSRDGRGRVRTADGSSQADGDPFRIMQELLARHPHLTAAGFWGYDLRHHVERLPRLAPDDLSLPDCRVGLFAQESPPDLPAPGAFRCTGAGSWSVARAAYESAVRRAQQYIAAGDCYQVNLSQRYSAPCAGDPYALYRRLREISPAPYSAYLDCGDFQVLSSSPELFLRIRDRAVETRPIKGTRPRGRTPEEDAAHAAQLLSSVKDRAELLMIVDLERNDLGRVCEYGSVQVPDLYRLESYANVHHLVATVRARLRPEVSPLECLRACFPGGSITGAPKIRAMEIIEELEPVRRGVYTGAIGWVDGRGNAEWNIAIRTMTVKGGRVYFHAGGGIVADSDPAAEYEETLAKAAGMLEALGQ